MVSSPKCNIKTRCPSIKSTCQSRASLPTRHPQPRVITPRICTRVFKTSSIMQRTTESSHSTQVISLEDSNTTSWSHLISLDRCPAKMVKSTRWPTTTSTNSETWTMDQWTIILVKAKDPTSNSRTWWTCKVSKMLQISQASHNSQSPSTLSNILIIIYRRISNTSSMKSLTMIFMTRSTKLI